MAARGNLWIAALAAVALLADGCARDASTNAGAVRRRNETRADRACAKLPVCQAYLRDVRERTYASWRADASREPGEVMVGMRFDASGNPLRVRIIRASSPELGQSLKTAVGYAAPFGLLPASMSFLKADEVILEFTLPRPK